MSTIYEPAKETARKIRLALKEAYPELPAKHFSVKTSTYSGGSSVSVSWTDYPNEADVAKITNKFQSAQMNGYEDMKEYTGYVWTDGKKYSGADFIFTHQDISDERRRVIEFIAMNLRDDYDPRTNWQLAGSIERDISMGLNINDELVSGKYVVSWERFKYIHDITENKIRSGLIPVERLDNKIPDENEIILADLYSEVVYGIYSEVIPYFYIDTDRLDDFYTGTVTYHEAFKQLAGTKEEKETVIKRVFRDYLFQKITENNLLIHIDRFVDGEDEYIFEQGFTDDQIRACMEFIYSQLDFKIRTYDYKKKEHGLEVKEEIKNLVDEFKGVKSKKSKLKVSPRVKRKFADMAYKHIMADDDFKSRAKGVTDLQNYLNDDLTIKNSETAYKDFGGEIHGFLEWIGDVEKFINSTAFKNYKGTVPFCTSKEYKLFVEEVKTCTKNMLVHKNRNDEGKRFSIDVKNLTEYIISEKFIERINEFIMSEGDDIVNEQLTVRFVNKCIQDITKEIDELYVQEIKAPDTDRGVVELKTEQNFRHIQRYMYERTNVTSISNQLYSLSNEMFEGFKNNKNLKLNFSMNTDEQYVLIRINEFTFFISIGVVAELSYGHIYFDKRGDLMVHKAIQSENVKKYLQAFDNHFRKKLKPFLMSLKPSVMSLALTDESLLRLSRMYKLGMESKEEILGKRAGANVKLKAQENGLVITLSSGDYLVSPLGIKNLQTHEALYEKGTGYSDISVLKFFEVKGLKTIMNYEGFTEHEKKYLIYILSTGLHLGKRRDLNK